MTGPSSGDRPAEETCGICGYSRAWHEGGGEMIHDFRPASPPAVRSGDDGHEHRWTPWRRAVPHFDSLGNETSVGIAQVSGLPNTAGWSRQCACGAIEAVPTERALSTPPPVPGTATCDDVARYLTDSVAAYVGSFMSCYDDCPAVDWQYMAEDFVESGEVVEEIQRLLAFGGSQPAQPAEEQRPIDVLTEQWTDGLRQRIEALVAAHTDQYRESYVSVDDLRRALNDAR